MNEKMKQELQEYAVLYPDTVEIEIGSQVYELGELKLKQMRPVLNAVVELFSIAEKHQKVFQKGGPEATELMINVGYAQVLAIAAAAVDKTPDWLEENISVLSFTRLVEAIIEVNDVGEIIKNALSVVRSVGPMIPRGLTRPTTQVEKN